MQEGVVTVMFTDVEGSTDVTRRLGDVEGRRLIESYKALVREELGRHDGREIDSIGDGFFVTFASTRRAVGCAVAIQRALLDQGYERPDEHVRVRVGLNVGEVIERDGHPFGAAVNATQRVAAHARGGQILVSEPVRHLAGTIPGVSFRDRGRREVKGFAERWRLYEVEWERPKRPARPPTVGAERKSHRKLRALMAGALALAVIAGALLAVVLTRRDDELQRIDANAVGILDGSSGKIVGQVNVGARPTSIASGEGALWVTNADDRTISRIDAATEEQAGVIGVGPSAPTDVAVGEGVVWVLSRFANEILAIDPNRNIREKTIPLPLGTGPAAIAVGGGYVWVANAMEDSVTRISPQTSDEKNASVGDEPQAIAYGEGGVWVANTQSKSVSRLSPVSGDVDRRAIALQDPPTAIAAGEGSVWVASRDGDTLTRIDSENDRSAGTIEVGNAPVAVAAGGGSVWVANSLDRSVWQLDPKTSSIVRKIPLGSSPAAIAVAGGRVWVTTREP